MKSKLKIHFLVVSIFMLFMTSKKADAQLNYNFAVTQNGSDNQMAKPNCAINAIGETYNVGAFVGTKQFGTYTLTSSSTSSDAYIAKYDALGNCLWAKGFGPASNSLLATILANKVCVDPSGNVYICGNFNGTLQVDSNSFASQGQSDNFLIKLDPSGNVINVKTSGGQSDEQAKSVCTDSQNNVYLVGSFAYKAFFDNDTLKTAGLSSISDVFIVKYDSAGNVLWAKSAGGTDGDIATGASFSFADNSLRVCGVVSGNGCIFGTHSINAAGSDAFIARYEVDSGKNVWVKKGGGNASDACNSVATDAFGNAYITGNIILSATFGSLPALNAGSYSEGFIAKIDSNGNYVWAKKFGCPGANGDAGYSIATDANGFSIVTGAFTNTISPVTTADFGSFHLTSLGGADIFIARLSPSGNFTYAGGFGSSGEDVGSGVSINGTDVRVVGNYTNTITFASTNLNTPGTVYSSFLVGFGNVFTGVNENNFSENSLLSVYPNPTSDMLHINFSSSEPKILKFEILNSIGQIVLQKNVDDLYEKSTEVNISKLGVGFYLLKGYTSNSCMINKVQVIR